MICTESYEGRRRFVPADDEDIDSFRDEGQTGVHDFVKRRIARKVLVVVQNDHEGGFDPSVELFEKPLCKRGNPQEVFRGEQNEMGTLGLITEELGDMSIYSLLEEGKKIMEKIKSGRSESS